MIHYTCDRCQKRIEQQALRYVVQMEMHAELDELESEFADDDIQLEQMEEILAELDEDAGDELMQDVYQRRRYDLCHECFRQFKNDPLGIINPEVDFSRN